jgi:uncharacterized membrane protein
VIGIIVEFLSLIPSILLVEFFRRIQTRQQPISPLYQMKSVDLNRNEHSEKKFKFPWWCLFIAYGICVILVGLSIVFMIVRGIEFGDLKTQKWLTSIVSGFFSSVVLIQPIKVKKSFLYFKK